MPMIRQVPSGSCRSAARKSGSPVCRFHLIDRHTLAIAWRQRIAGPDPVAFRSMRQSPTLASRVGPPANHERVPMTNPPGRHRNRVLHLSRIESRNQRLGVQVRVLQVPPQLRVR